MSLYINERRSGLRLSPPSFDAPGQVVVCPCAVEKGPLEVFIVYLTLVRPIHSIIRPLTNL